MGFQVFKEDCEGELEGVVQGGLKGFKEDVEGGLEGARRGVQGGGGGGRRRQLPGATSKTLLDCCRTLLDPPHTPLPVFLSVETAGLQRSLPGQCWHWAAPPQILPPN